jgi:cholesterol transport system auxiliary component
MMIRFTLSTLASARKFTRYLTIFFGAPLLLLVSACASTEVQRSYDFGSNVALPASNQLATLKLNLTEIQVPVSLEGSAMLYRLLYDNPQELRAYANSRWSMPPAQLLKQRIIARINQEGGAVSSSADGIAGLPVLRIDLEEFAQVFSTPGNSQVQLRWRASLIHNQRLLAQKVFSAQTSGNSTDAAGGARAMPQATDQAITELIVWLQTQLK